MVAVPCLTSWVLAVTVGATSLQPVAHAPAEQTPEVKSGEASPAAQPVSEAPPESAADRAEQAFKTGKELFLAGRYDEAAAAFQRSYEAVPDANTLHNVAVSLERADRPIEAITALRRLIERFAPTPDELREYERRMADQMRKVASLELHAPTKVQVVRVRVAGRDYGPGDFPLLQLPGPVTVEVYDGEGLLQTQELELAAGARLILAPFERDKGAADPPRVEPEPEARPNPAPTEARWERARRGWFWGTAAAGVAAGVAAVVTGTLARQAEQAFDDGFCETNAVGVCRNPGAVVTFPDDKARALRLQRTTNILIGVGAVFGVTALVLGVTRPRAARKQARAAAGRGGLVIRF